VNATDTPDPALNWLMSDFVQRNKPAGAASATLTSADGVLIGHSSGIPADNAEKVAAIVSGLLSLASGGARFFEAGPVKSTIVDMQGGSLYVSAIHGQAGLGVLASPHHDPDQLLFEITQLREKVGAQIAGGLRLDQAPDPA
jgi:predicted regulator of Ras-like GTPase activity (Roadblock/LC7/MglB family)